jgi:hypothetical protein
MAPGWGVDPMKIWRRLVPVASLLLLGVVGVAPAAQASHSSFAPGDLFVGIGSNKVQWWHPGSLTPPPPPTLNRTMTTSTSSPSTTGMALDPGHNLYVTGYTSNSINRFNTTGAAIATFGTGFNSHPEGIAFDHDGFAYVGQEGGSRDILKFRPGGSLERSYDAPTEVKGTDRLDVASDQCTIFYTSQGRAVKRFDACANGGAGAPMSDFNTAPLPGTEAFDVKILLTGGVLVADSQSIVRLNSLGAVMQTYDPSAAQNNCWTALSLGTTTNDFWAGDRCSGNVYRLDLTTGQVISSIPGGKKISVQGLAVNKGLTAATATDLSVTLTDTPDTGCTDCPPVSASRPNENPPEISRVLYTADVANAGPGQARAVTVTSTIAGGGTFDFAVGDGWTCPPPPFPLGTTTVSCTRTSNLGIGATAEPLFLVVIVPETNVDLTLTNTATVVGNEADPDPTDDSDTETTAVDDAPAPNRFVTFCPGATGCAGHTVLGVDDITQSFFVIPPDSGQVGGVTSFEEGAQTFPCGSNDDSDELNFTIPAGYTDPTNPVVITVQVELPGSGIPGPNAPYCILKPVGPPQVVEPCDVPGVANPSPCENPRSFSDGTLSMTLLVLSGDPRGHN